MERWQEVLSIVVQAVVVAAIPVFAKLLNDWVKAKSAEIAAAYPSEWDRAEELIKSVVMAAEQMGANGQVQDKLAWAVNEADTLLQRYGIDLDEQQIRLLIESQVHNYLRYK